MKFTKLLIFTFILSSLSLTTYVFAAASKPNEKTSAPVAAAAAKTALTASAMHLKTAYTSSSSSSSFSPNKLSVFSSSSSSSSSSSKTPDDFLVKFIPYANGNCFTCLLQYLLDFSDQEALVTSIGKILALERCSRSIYYHITTNDIAIAVRKGLARRNSSIATLPIAPAYTKGFTILHLAANRGYKNVLQVLMIVNPNTNIDLQDAMGETPLMTAAFNGHLTCVELLITSGANVEIATANGNTARDSTKSHYDISPFGCHRDQSRNSAAIRDAINKAPSALSALSRWFSCCRCKKHTK